MKIQMSSNRLACWLVLILALLASFQAQATLLLYEPFSTNKFTTDNQNLYNSVAVTGWDVGYNASSAGDAVVNSASALIYPGLVTSNDSRGLDMIANTTTINRSVGKYFSASQISSGTIYCSFLVNVVTAPTANRALLALSSWQGGVIGGSANRHEGGLGTVWIDSSRQLLLGKSTTATSSAESTFGSMAAGTTAALTAGQSYFVVLKYTFNTGTTSDDLVSLYFSPTPGTAEPGSPTLSTSTGVDKSLRSVWVLQGRTAGGTGETLGSDSGEVKIDEIRVGDTWADVTPSSCIPGTSFSVTGGGAYCSGGSGVSVGLSGSETGLDYQLKLNGTDVGSAVAGTGSALDFGLQTAGGVYSVQASNTTSACIGGMSGNATVTVNTSPSIGSQPVAQNPVLGGVASFTVSASGGGLSHQWRRNGTNLVNGGNITGATSSNLVIYPVANDNVATASDGYDVVVSGTCSPSATSDRVALTLHIPGNLTWVGDGSLNLWDTTTANWTGDATTFATADTVSFTDSGSATPGIILVGDIAPSLIKVDATQEYSITNSVGNRLSGTAILTKTNTGRLVLVGVNNTFSGNIAVNGGTLSAQGGVAAGVRPVDSPSALGALNPARTITVNSGATLTFTNSNDVFAQGGSAGVTPAPQIVVNSGGALVIGNISTDETGNGSGNNFGKITLNGGSMNFLKGYNTIYGAAILTDTITVGGSSASTIAGNGMSNSVANLGYASSTVGITFDVADATGNGNADLVVTAPLRGAPAIGASPTSLTKTGSGTMLLNATNTYTGKTVVNGGTLGGTGTIVGPVEVAGGGNLAPGASIGILTINNTLTLNGTFTAEVDRGASPNCDQVVGVTSNAYGGTLSIVNIGAALEIGDTFQIFPATTYSGNFANITPSPGSGKTWSFDPATGILSVVSNAGGPPTLGFSKTGSTLTFSWTGAFKLQSQTNSLSAGISNNPAAWSDYPDASNPVNVIIIPANPTVFFRLINQ
jgi:autotransporter-associated beta strand protein